MMPEAASIGTAKPMPMKTRSLGRVDDAADDADDAAVEVDQRAAGVAGVHRRVELDHVLQHLAGLLDDEAAAEGADDAGADAAFEAEGRADRHHLVALAHAAGEHRRLDAVRAGCATWMTARSRSGCCWSTVPAGGACRRRSAP